MENRDDLPIIITVSPLTDALDSTILLKIVSIDMEMCSSSLQKYNAFDATKSVTFHQNARKIVLSTQL